MILFLLIHLMIYLKIVNIILIFIILVGNGLLYILLHLSINYDITKCNPRVAIANVELNSNAQYGAKLCYDFLNSGKCRREKKHGSCAYRHLPENHIHAIIERIRSGKVGGVSSELHLAKCVFNTKER